MDSISPPRRGKIDLSALDAMPQRQTLAMTNQFVASIAAFVNKFALQCEERLEHIADTIERVDLMLTLFESKLRSVPWLDPLEEVPLSESDEDNDDNEINNNNDNNSNDNEEATAASKKTRRKASSKKEVTPPVTSTAAASETAPPSAPPPAAAAPPPVAAVTP
ncbi:MAG: hypothetical protein MHM6MM_009178, partial [Cercozoa sp. M6MM]